VAQLDEQKRKYDNDMADAKRELQQEIKKGNELKQANARLDMQMNEMKNQKIDMTNAFKKQEGELRETQKQLANELAAKTAWLQDKDKLMEENTDLKSKLDVENTARQGLIRKLDTQQKQADTDLNNQKSEYAKLTKKYNELLEAKKVADTRIGELKTQLADQDKVIKGLQNDVKDLNDKLDTELTQNKTLLQTKAALEEEAAKNKARADSVTKDKQAGSSAVAEKIRSLENDVTVLTGKLKNESKEKKGLDEIKTKLESSNKELETKLRDTTNENKQLLTTKSKLESELQRYELQITTMTESSKAAEAEQLNLKKKTDAQEKASTSSDKERGVLENKFKQTEKKNLKQKLMKKKTELKLEYSNYRKAKELELGTLKSKDEKSQKETKRLSEIIKKQEEQIITLKKAAIEGGKPVKPLTSSSSKKDLTSGSTSPTLERSASLSGTSSKKITRTSSQSKVASPTTTTTTTTKSTSRITTAKPPTKTATAKTTSATRKGSSSTKPPRPADTEGNDTPDSVSDTASVGETAPENDQPVEEQSTDEPQPEESIENTEENDKKEEDQ